MRVVVFIFALATLACAYTDVEYETAFREWMHVHARTYATSEFHDRFQIFKDNMDYVRDFNAQNTGTILGMNNMADLTNAEYRSIYLGYKMKPVPASHTNMMVTIPHQPRPHNQAPNITIAVDWRAKGAVTPIKNQGQCGSCWSFSTTGSTEGAYFQKTGKLVSLSEQNLVDCSTAQGNQGCNGGLMDNAFQYIITNKGIDTEASYPYTAQDGTCAFNAANVGATIASYVDVAAKSEVALAAAVDIQPVSVAIDASHISFQLYRTGVYHSDICSQTALDHGVLAVGYGVEDGSNFWIVKNSWGTTWGQEGYIFMSKDKNNNCGIATQASRPTA